MDMNASSAGAMSSQAVGAAVPGRVGESPLTARLRAMMSWPTNREHAPQPRDPVANLVKAHRQVHPNGDAALLRRSYQVAERMHRGQMRKSGDPYITHPLAVAEILADIGMDSTTLSAALLHDTVEDTSYTLSQLRSDFGSDVALLVDGVTKFDKAHFGDRAEAEAETIRKMIVTAGRDIRVLVVKLADRLHNMQTLDARSPASRARIAGATREVLVPLCDRLGIQALKRELEDVVLLHLEPEEYQRIHDMVSRRPRWNDYLGKVVELAGGALRRDRLAGRVEPRPRHYYTIWKDTREAGSPAPMDPPRIVVVLDGEDFDCYAALGAIHQQWRPIPGRFKDFIAVPKNNLYRSLHTTVLGPDDQMLEVLIRTEQMHRDVEYGVVAKYRYPSATAKRTGALGLFRAALSADARQSGDAGQSGDARQSGDADSMAWLDRALAMEQAAPDAVQFVQTLRYDLAEMQIHVFARGKSLLLPAGATPVDVAYELGTRVGDKCVAATVNGVLTPLNAALSDGDVVDILVSRDRKHPGPRPEWLDFVVSPNARLWLNRRFVETKTPAGTVGDRLQIGRAAIGLALRRRSRALSEEQRLIDLANDMGLADLDSLLIAVAEHRIHADDVVDQLILTVDSEPVAERPVAGRQGKHAAAPTQRDGSGAVSAAPSTNLSR